MLRRIEKILDLIVENNKPFIAKIRKDDVVLWKSTHSKRPKEKEAEMKKGKSKPPSAEYQRFEKLAKQLISVPKSEIEKRQAEYEQCKKAEKKKKSA